MAISPVPWAVPEKTVRDAEGCRDAWKQNEIASGKTDSWGEQVMSQF